MIIYISELAEHTKNLRKNSKCSLIVKESDHQDDVQTAGRLTWVGNAEEVTNEEDNVVKIRYFRNFPWS